MSNQNKRPATSDDESSGEPRKKIAKLEEIQQVHVNTPVQQINEENADPNITILEKTPDGKGYTIEQRPRRSKHLRRSHPGVELLSR